MGPRNITIPPKFIPPWSVQEFHSFPHMSDNFKLVSNDFGIDYEQPFMNEYTASIATLCILIAASGLFGVVLLQMLLSCRCLFPALKCAPDATNVNPDRFKFWSAWISRYRTTLQFFFFFFIICLLCAIFSLWPGKVHMDDGVRVTLYGLKFVYKKFRTLFIDGTALQGKMKLIKDYQQLALPKCLYAARIDGNIAEFTDVVEKFLEYTTPNRLYLKDTIITLFEWAVTKRAQTVYIIFIYATLLVGSFGYFYYKMDKEKLQYCIAASQVFCACMSIFCAFELFMLVGVADFCQEPRENYLKNLPFGSIRNLNSYYTQCRNETTQEPFTNPLEWYLQYAQDQSKEMNETLHTLMEPFHGGCTNNYYLRLAVNEYRNMLPIFADINETYACDPIYQTSFKRPIEYGLCRKMFYGNLVIWSSHAWTSLFFFCLSCVVSVLYQYFKPEYWLLEASEAPPEHLQYEIPDRKQLSENQLSDDELPKPVKIEVFSKLDEAMDDE